VSEIRQRDARDVDLQASEPEVRLALSRAGVRGGEKAIRIRYRDSEKLMTATIDCAVDLDPGQKGVHMSRFTELFEEAIEAVVLEEASLVEELAEHVARRIVERQGAGRAEVRIAARYPLARETPVTKLETQELVGLIGIAAAIGASGGVLVNVAFRQSFLTYKTGDAAYMSFIAFYAVCFVVTWVVYLRTSPRKLAGV